MYLFLDVYKILLSSFKNLPKQAQPRKASVELFFDETPVIFRILLPCLAITYASPSTSSTRLGPHKFS